VIDWHETLICRLALKRERSGDLTGKSPREKYNHARVSVDIKNIIALGSSREQHVQAAGRKVERDVMVRSLARLSCSMQHVSPAERDAILRTLPTW
jgi:hypothetical protein